MFIVESLSPKDFFERWLDGHAANEILRILNIETEYRIAFTRPLVERAISEAADGNFEALHFSSHGNSSGICLTNGKDMSWPEFVELVKPASGRNKALVMATCGGGDKELTKALTAAGVVFGWVFGSTSDTVTFSDSCLAWSILYNRLVDHGFQRPALMTTLRAINAASRATSCIAAGTEESTFITRQKNKCDVHIDKQSGLACLPFRHLSMPSMKGDCSWAPYRSSFSRHSTGSSSRSYVSGCLRRSMTFPTHSRWDARVSRRTVSTSMVGQGGMELSAANASGSPISMNPGGAVTRAFLRKEAKAALKFQASLMLWILATTARRDARVQAWVDELNEEWENEDRDRIAIVWTWYECISHLNSFPTLQRWYYQDVIQVRASKDLDEIILRTIAMAFARPAFEVPLHCETPNEFLQALKDSQKALRTGELVDRESRQVIRKAIGGYHELDDDQARLELGRIDKQLRQLRTQLEQGLRDKIIQRIDGYLNIQDGALARHLEELRQQCVDDLNHVLSNAGLPTI
ncbi:hypothetical protein [Mesorhizobium sangaii]|uniref:CHAT domain-containing protein n=1 Tax=Mesorhizobium sangaii TaxID=505389 RepID=A0A841PY96_9HYPH|nr:hypothetical protein [Mesorhizobium sangaii]MBB6413705.1 hypothetical protein [Mesorhizobium sangaii]